MISKTKQNTHNKLYALIEVSILEILFFIVAWYLMTVLPSNTAGWITKSFMICLALIAMIAHKKISEYGLNINNLMFSLKWSLYIFLFFLGCGLVLLGLFSLTGFAKIIGDIDITKIAVDFVWYLVMVGFAEELFFRGYVQSRLNEVFTKKYEKILGWKFEWHQGTLIAGIFFFGIPHIFVSINPFTGDLTVEAFYVIIAIFASFLGVIFGAMREKTGNIITCTVFHMAVDFFALSFFYYLTDNIMVSNMIVFITLGIFFGTLFEKFLSGEK